MKWMTLIFIGKVILTIFHERKRALCVDPSAAYEGVCGSSACIREESRLRSLMDTSADPCEDFYTFACGKAKENNLTVEYFKLIEKMKKEKLNLGEPIRDTENYPTRSSKAVYQTCMTLTTHIQPVQNMIEKLGGWPVLENNWTDVGHITWENYFEKISSENLVPDDFFRVLLGSRTSSKSYDLIIETSKRNFVVRAQDFARGKQLRSRMRSILSDTIKLFGVNDRNKINEATKEYIVFSSKLLCACEMLGKTSVYTFVRLANMLPEFPWLRILEAALRPIRLITSKSIKPSFIHFIYTDDLRIKVACKSCLRAISLLVQKTPKRTLANYVAFRTVIKAIPYFSETLRERVYRILDVLRQAKNTPTSRKEYCESLISNRCLPGVDSSNYMAKRQLLVPIKESVTQIAYHIKKRFVQLLNVNDWLDEKTRYHAMDKVWSMYMKIAYPDDLMYYNVIKGLYLPLETMNLTNHNEYWNVVLTLNKRQNDRKLVMFFRHRDLREDWTTTVTNVDPFYDAVDNSITIPLGLLQDAIFSPDMTLYLNYASVGFFIAREMIHSLLEPALRYNKYGEVDDSCVTRSNYYNYKERKYCFSRQYRRMDEFVSGIPHATGRIISENLADIQGAILAYKTFVLRMKSAERMDPALSNHFAKYTSRQMFWIYYASLWCDHNFGINPKKYKDPNHSPASLRVYNVIINSKKFAADWRCSANAAMNYKNKCFLYF